MKFDFTINIGEILTAGGLLIGFFVAHTQNIQKLQDIKTKMDLMYEWFQKTVILRRPED